MAWTAKRSRPGADRFHASRAGGSGALGTTIVILAVSLALFLPSCGVYSTRPGSLPDHVKRIAIPTFDNRTVEVGLDQEITQAVVSRFIEDNHLKVVGAGEADALLSGSVVDYKNAIFGFTGQEQAEEYRVSITVAVRVLDKVKNRELWRDDALLKTQNYYVVQVPGQQAQDERSGRQEAIRKIADEILSRTVENW